MKLLLGDCLELMKTIPDQSVDMVLCDLPYGTTACKWDTIIPLEPLWEQYRRIIKKNSPIVLFSQQPFTSLLISSNFQMYKYNWVWEKDNGTNFLAANHQPLKVTEDICVFGYGAITESKNGEYLTYNPQMRQGYSAYKCKSGKQKEDTAIIRTGGAARNGGHTTISNGERYPINIIHFDRDAERYHPTQKPIDLLRYLILTHSNEGDTILDNTMGSGSTGVAAVMEKRNFIGIELNKEYFDIAQKRINDAVEETNSRLF